MTFADNKVFKLDTATVNTIAIQFIDKVVTFKLRKGTWERTVYNFPIMNIPKPAPVTRKAMITDIRNLIADGGQAVYSYTEDLVA